MTHSESPILRILVASADRADFVSVRAAVAAVTDLRAELAWVSAAAAASERIAADHCDICLVSADLDDRPGLDWLLETLAQGVRIPLAFLAGRDDEEASRSALGSGALDSLDRNHLSAATLTRSLRFALERATLERALLAERERYRLLFEHAPIPMLMCNLADGRILLANRAVARLYGYDPEELVGGLNLSGLWPAHAVPSLDLDRIASATGRAAEHRHRRKDGSLLDVSLHAEAVDLGTDRVLLLKILDIGTQLRAERAMREQSKQLRKILADVTDGLLVIDENGRVQLANAAAGRILATPAERLEGQSLPLPLEPDGQNEDLSLTHADGTRLELEARIAHTQWQGSPARIVTLRDVSEAARTQAQLRMLSRAVEASHSAIMIADARQPDLPIVFANPAFEQVTGYSIAEALGRNCRFLHGNDRDQPEIEEVRSAIRDGRECNVLLRNYRKDGSRFWNQLTLSPMRDGNGAIRHFLAIATDVTREVEREAELAAFANRDPTTQLPLFTGLKSLIETQIDAARRDDDALALLLIDIDQFDNINRSLSHDFGDEVLRKVAQRIDALLDGRGTLSRLAADVFVALVPCRQRSLDPLALAEDIRAEVQRVLRLPPYDLNLSCTIGVALSPDQADSLKTLLNNAQTAMRKGKLAGRNTVVAFRSEFAEELRDRIALGSRLRDAVIEGELKLHFQPQVNGHDGRIIGLEALVRWQSPEHGLVMPSRFIGVAEDLGIIVPLGKWVLRETCRVLRGWLEAGHDDVFVSVNVSTQQLLHEDFCEEVLALLAEHGVPPSMLEIEITESAIVENTERVRSIMMQLRHAGIRLALDDFGTGYSSLSYLKRLPIDKLKIDRCFVSEVTIDSNDAAIARAIIAMGHQLRMVILAEGIETPEQLGFLRRNHCDLFQGYLLGRPLDATATEALLRMRYLLPEAFEATRPDRVLLLVDDEENILRALTRVFRREGYRILTASSVEQAFSLLASHRVQVILSDQRMPDCSGTEFLGRVKELYPDTIRMILSGYTDLSTVTEAINRGAIYRFLTKPWDDEELRSHIREAFRAHVDSGNAPETVAPSTMRSLAIN